MKFICFVILCLLLGFTAVGQEVFSEPEAKLITHFPFRQFSGGVIVVNARFDNVKDTLNFILDTGSGGISLDSATCSEFNILLTASDTTITGIGGIRKVPFAFNKTLHLQGLSIPNLNFHVNDYSVLTSVYGQKIDGIIGYSFFSKYIVKVNFDSSFIEVFSKGRIEYPKKGTILNPVFTALPIQWATLKDRTKFGYNFYLDTGAGLYLLLSEKFVKDSSILLSRRKPVLTQAEGMAGKSQMKLTVIKELKIGTYKFRNVPTYIYNDEYNVTNYPYIGGLIGNDLLRRFNLIINYGAKEIHLLPNSNFREPFDYAYTGLGIYFVDGVVVVEDVIAKSPADRAGFEVDDEIIGVNNNLSNNIQVYKDILQTPNETIKVLVRRKNKLKLLTLNTVSIR
jgi:Aspartyl protease/PDZ domain